MAFGSSTFPSLPLGHLLSGVYALAGKIATDILKNDTLGPGYTMGRECTAMVGAKSRTLERIKSNGVSGVRSGASSSAIVALSLLVPLFYCLISSRLLKQVSRFLLRAARDHCIRGRPMKRLMELFVIVLRCLPFPSKNKRTNGMLDRC